jgi:hypothetical protein
MPIYTPTLCQEEPLAEKLERRINERTNRRVCQLHIERTDGRTIVHGFTSSYYVKQLVLAAVQEVSDQEPIEVHVWVN